MSKEELKQKLHRLIDDMEDEQSLHLLYEDAVDYKTASEVEDELSPEQWAEIAEGIHQVEKGEIVSQEEMMEKFKHWRNAQ